MRVQIPAYTDRWMMGDRYGEAFDTVYRRRSGGQSPIWWYRVKLDKSGKIVRVVADDCKEV